MESTLTSPPDHILLTILSLLPTDALLRLRAVCTHWNTLITSRNTLRSITFLHPPSPPLPSLRGAHPVLHPVLKKITHQPDGPSLHGSPLPAHSVANSMLSRPAASTLAVWGRGGIAAVLERPAGIRVADALSLVSEAITAGFWDQTAYQLAGLRLIPSMSAEGRLVVAPEFFDGSAVVVRLREGRWEKARSEVRFCFDLPMGCGVAVV